MEKSNIWWGDFSLPVNTWAGWRIGPLMLHARTAPREWRFAWTSGSDPLDPTVEVNIPGLDEPDPSLFSVDSTRVGMESPGTRLNLRPRLADLPVVVRTETPLHLPPGESTVLFISTVLWVSASPSGREDILLVEMPVMRPSDTWYGPNTRKGEACYASLSKARTSPDLLARVWHRAVTPLNIVNAGTDRLLIEQLRVPVTALSVYEGADGLLWTDAITFTRRSASTASAHVEIHTDGKFLPETRQCIASPRKRIERNTLADTFSRLFT